MRWVLLFLVAVNAGYFSWQMLQGGLPGAEKSDVDAAVDSAVDQPRLRLLAEVPGAAGLNEKAREAQRAASTANARMCWLLGPLPEEVTAKQILMRFQGQGIDARLQELEAVTSLEYLVYTGPYPSRSEALSSLRDMQSKQLDSFVITRGELTDAISLGLFTSRRQVEQAVAELAELGYAAKSRESERVELQHWLVMPVTEAQNLGASFWQELESDFNHLDRQQKRCDTIASVDGMD
jgi:hypothetical protein